MILALQLASEQSQKNCSQENSTMKAIALFPLIVWLSLGFAVNSAGIHSNQLQVPEERDIITRKELDAYLASKDDMTSGIVDLTKAGVEGIGALARIDYKQSGGQIAWEVASAVVPIIGAALALIPGVGVIVSGVFMGLWSLISPMFAPKADNPVEKMINEMAKKLRKEMDEKLSNFVRLAIYGEIVRNNYICNKYNYIFQFYSDPITNGTSLKANDALNVKLYLNDCDNFLKDTAEAFVYDDYADVLWVPGAITTSSRLAFLAEIIKYGHLVGLTQNVIAMYLKELQKDTQRHFEYHAKGMDLIWRRNKQSYSKIKKDQIINVTQVEKAACALESQFYYFDRSLYPYGMPTILNSTDMFADIKMADHYKPSSKTGGDIKHLQIFFKVDADKYAANLPKREHPYEALEFMNCFLGPMYVTSPNTYWFNFEAMPAKNTYSYEFRVLFFQTYVLNDSVKREVGVPLLTELKKGTDKFNKYLDVHKKVNKENVDLSGRTCLNIEFVFPDHPKYKESKKLIDITGSSHWKKCPLEKSSYGMCNRFIEMFIGKFKLYSAGTYNHKNEVLNRLIVIDDPAEKTYSVKPSGFLVGLEIILRPLIS